MEKKISLGEFDYSKLSKKELINMLQSVQEYKQKIPNTSNISETIQFLMNNLKINWNIENFGILFLNTQNDVLEIEIVASGTVDKVYLYPKEIAKLLLSKEKAKSIILFHNHPSNRMIPSQQDINITRKIKGIAELLDMNFLDHLILKDYCLDYYSFLEDNML